MFDTCTAGQNGDELLRNLYRKERERDKNRKIDRQTKEKRHREQKITILNKIFKSIFQ
jgi:hypothetical protein